MVSFWLLDDIDDVKLVTAAAAATGETARARRTRRTGRSDLFEDFPEQKHAQTAVLAPCFAYVVPFEPLLVRRDHPVLDSKFWKPVGRPRGRRVKVHRRFFPQKSGACQPAIIAGQALRVCSASYGNRRRVATVAQLAVSLAPSSYQG